MKGKTVAALLLPFLIFFMIFLPTLALAQGPGGPGGSGDPACDPQCNCYPDPPYAPCPIDSYLYILLGVSVFYGIKKAKGQKQSASASSIIEN
jgi:hypothetical protein